MHTLHGEYVVMVNSCFWLQCPIKSRDGRHDTGLFYCAVLHKKRNLKLMCSAVNSLVLLCR